MPKIFISYRRADSEHVCGRIYDRLTSEYGTKSIFKDVNSIKQGEDFRHELDRSLNHSDIVIIVIGHEWLGIDENGNRRIDEEVDYVRIETEKALARKDLQVIPMLVKDAKFPQIEDLPESIQDLAFRHAVSVRTDPNFHTDMDQVIRGINLDFPKRNKLIPSAATACFILAGAIGVGSSFTHMSKPTTPLANVVTEPKLPIQKSPSKALKKPQPEAEEPQLADDDFLADAQKLLYGDAAKQSVEKPSTKVSKPQKTSLKLSNGMMLKLISPGQFTMGNSTPYNQSPAHTVNIAYSFWMSETEVTFKQYDAYVQSVNSLEVSKPNSRGWGRGNRPVIEVSWDDAQGYLKWLSKTNAQGLRCRLPSEAEWEYVARSTAGTPYSWGSSISSNKANCLDCNSQWNKKTAPVKSFKHNKAGLYDMHGNVAEWVEDRWQENYQGAPADGSAWLKGDSQSKRVTRGGSWNTKSQLLTSFHRQSLPSNSRNSATGFRVICQKK